MMKPEPQVRGTPLDKKVQPLTLVGSFNSSHLVGIFGDPACQTGDPDRTLQSLARLDRSQDEPSRLRRLDSIKLEVPQSFNKNCQEV